MKKNIAKSLIPITSKGKIIAKKIACKLINLPEKYNINDVNKTWIPAWHGTKFTCLESIAKQGLKPPGDISIDGDEIEVQVDHIKRKKTIFGIEDWGTAIFVSPSIFYCAYHAYAKEISIKNESYKVLVECRVKPNSYNEYGSTCPYYEPKDGETEMLEFRIEPKNEEDVQVVSLTFVKNEFFESAEQFKEGDIFITDNIEN